MTDRKPIDSFVKLTDSRFENIDKSPSCLSTVKNISNVNIKNQDRRRSLFPEQAASTFYDSKKELTMKDLKLGTIPWDRMSKKPIAS